MQLSSLGWNDYFAAQFAEFDNTNYFPGRISRENRNNYGVLTENGESLGELSGRFMHTAAERGMYPAVGDWVVLQAQEGRNRTVIHAVLPRLSQFSRKAVRSGGNPDAKGRTEEQVLAANIDTVFLISGLDMDFNLRRIERYTTIAWDSGASPVIILNKADLCADIDEKIAAVEEIAIGVPIFAISAATGSGLEQVSTYLSDGQTIAFLGSSGVGKSTLINALAGTERMKTTDVRDYDNRGRHTTTHRELIVLDTGGVVIDTPGLRVLKAWDNEEGLERTFSDIEEIASQCRFADCKHESEPGCAIRGALDSGAIDPKRYQSYLKLQKELAHLARRKDVKRIRQESREWDKKVRRHHEAMKQLRKRGLA
ncbi:MAG: ribosome small subunit-dependent GTPase A [Candidatus Zixiibacteriota bacterium]